MLKDCQINLRLTKDELAYIKRQAKGRGITNSTWILNCIYNKYDLMYIQTSEPVELSKLKPPKGPPKAKKQITATQPRGKIDRRGFLNEIRDVFKDKGIFIN